MTTEAKLARLRVLADEIESEMRRIGLWMDEPPSEEEVLKGGAFGLGTVAFDTWVQVVFVTRLRQAADGAFPLPETSSVGAQAAREWDGAVDRDRLQQLIFEVDELIES